MTNITSVSTDRDGLTTDVNDSPPTRCGARGKSRLHIAARLMRFNSTSQVDELAFLAHVLGAIRRQTEPSQVQLRDLVDWVEAYESEEKVARPARVAPHREG